MKMRNSKRVIYTSSYDRGLEHLLVMWPEVKKAVPDAELHIFYGWQLFERFHKDNPASMRWMEKVKEMMKAGGITEHGRVPQDQIAEEMKQSGVWAYPTHFGEINCITALKAQAYGAVPVVTNYAALETSVQFGIKVKGDIYDPEVQKVFKDQLIWALQNPGWQEELRKPMTTWASTKFLWKNIALHWDSEFMGKPYEFWDKPKTQFTKLIDGYSGKEVEVKHGK